MRRALVAAACILGAWSAPAGAVTTLNIIPHGQFEPGVPWASTPGLLPADTQARMYDRITPLFRDITDAQLQPSTDGSGYYKSSAYLDQNDPSFISTETATGTSPSAGPVTATIKRDNYGVPHVYSDTDAGVIFGAGYVVAEDRTLLIQQARYNGIAGLIDMPGVPAIQLILGLYSYKPSPSVVKQATDLQTKSILAEGADGKRLLNDIDTYVAGMNVWFKANSPSTAPITRTDIYALNAVKAQFLGEGGGEEVPNALMLDGLRKKLGAKNGTGAYEDLRGRNDAETYTTTSKRFPWQTDVPVTNARGAVNLVNGSFKSSAPKLPGASARAKAASVDHPRGPEQKASNILIASGSKSATGAPLFVGGPQIGFNYPGLTLEIAEYGPTIRFRGATSAPFPGYGLIGRGADDVFTLTSAGADIVDTYAEKLCGGSKTKYVYKGKCRSMTTVKAGTISKGGKSVSVTFRRTVHGPVIGYAKRRGGGGKLVALSQRRSSYGRETTDQIFFQKLTYNEVHNASDFAKAAARTPQTFNSFYANATQSSFFTSGLLPMRPTGVNPDLPTDGTGKYEWKGYLAPSKHPQTTNPSSGYIVNWNNKPAKDFPASDERWSENSLQRVNLLQDELNRAPQQTLASVLAAANAGATEDVRVVEFWPTLKAMLAKGKAPSARAATMASLLQAWHDAGGSRRDADHDGKIDDPGAAIMDAAWRGISSAGLCDRLGATLCKQLEGRNGRFDGPPGGQYGGWHQYMWKDLRKMLGRSEKDPYHVRYCGDGVVSRCAKELWAAIDQAGATLAKQQGADPAAWRKPEAPEKIHFSPFPLFDMDYTNKPTGIHQVVTYGP